MGRERGLEHPQGNARQLHHFQQFFGRIRFHRGGMPIRNHHEMPVAVGKRIQDDKGVFAPMHNEVGRIMRFPFGGKVAKNTALRLSAASIYFKRQGAQSCSAISLCLLLAFRAPVEGEALAGFGRFRRHELRGGFGKPFYFQDGMQLD